MTVEYSTIVLGPGEGKVISQMGIEFTYKAVGSETGGAYFCMEYRAPAGWAGPPKHVHNNMEEVFYWWRETLLCTWTTKRSAEHGYPPPPHVMEALGRKYDMEVVGPRPGS